MYHLLKITKASPLSFKGCCLHLTSKERGVLLVTKIFEISSLFSFIFLQSHCPQWVDFAFLDELIFCLIHYVLDRGIAGQAGFFLEENEMDKESSLQQILDY